MSTQDVKVALNTLEYQQQLEADRDAWRAQAEALAGALDRLTKVATNHTIPFGMPLASRPTNRDVLSACDDARAALAHLPAQALAERRALEAVVEDARWFAANDFAYRARDWRLGIASLKKKHVLAADLAAVDAARGEGGA